MEKSARLVADGAVRFSVATKMPQWPTKCVVCGGYCAETIELWSKKLEAAGRGEVARKGDLKFAIPLHVKGDVCYSKFIRPITVRSVLTAALVSAAFGGLMVAILRPEPANRWVIFAIFSVLAAVTATVTIKVRFPAYIAIWQEDYSEFTAYFRDGSQAQDFAGLNRDIVRPWTRPKWLDPLLKWR